MQQRENQKKGIVTELSRGLPSKKRKAKTQTCEGLRMRFKMNKPFTPFKDKDILAIGAPITDKAHIAEMNTLRRSQMEEIKMNQKRNLFEPTRDYIMGNSSLEEKMFQRVIRKKKTD